MLTNKNSQAVTVKRSLEITEVVITPQSLRSLVKVILEQYKNDLKCGADENNKILKHYYDENRKELESSNSIIREHAIRQYESKKELLEDKLKLSIDIEFLLQDSNGIVYESQHENLISEGEYLEDKKIVLVSVTYRNAIERKKIFVNLQHSKYFASSINISGNNEDWVNGLHRKMEDTVNHWQKQVQWPHKYRGALGLSISVVITWLYVSVVELVSNLISVLFPGSPLDIRIDVSKNNYLWVWLIYWLLLYGVGFVMIGVPWAGNWLNKLCNLYPKVEFAMGPEHLQIERLKRRRLYIIIGYILVPILANTLYELSKLIVLSK